MFGEKLPQCLALFLCACICPQLILSLIYTFLLNEVGALLNANARLARGEGFEGEQEYHFWSYQQQTE